MLLQADGTAAKYVVTGRPTHFLQCLQNVFGQ